MDGAQPNISQGIKSRKGEIEKISLHYIITQKCFYYQSVKLFRGKRGFSFSPMDPEYDV